MIYLHFRFVGSKLPYDLHLFMFIPTIKVRQHASAEAVISVNEVIVKDIHEHVHKLLAHKL